MSANTGSNGGAPPSSGREGAAPGTDALLASLGEPEAGEASVRSGPGATRVAGAPTTASGLAAAPPRYTLAQRALAFGASLTASFLVGLPVVLHHDGLLGSPPGAASQAAPRAPEQPAAPPQVAVTAPQAPAPQAPAQASVLQASPPQTPAPEAPAKAALAQKPRVAATAPAKSAPAKPAAPPTPPTTAPPPHPPALQHGALLQ